MSTGQQSDSFVQSQLISVSLNKYYLLAQAWVAILAAQLPLCPPPTPECSERSSFNKMRSGRFLCSCQPITNQTRLSTCRLQSCDCNSCNRLISLHFPYCPKVRFNKHLLGIFIDKMKNRANRALLWSIIDFSIHTIASEAALARMDF